MQFTVENICGLIIRSRLFTPEEVKSLYQRLLNRAWADAKRRGSKLPPLSQKDIPPEVPGQQ